MSCLVNDDRSDAGRLFHVVGPWIAEERNQPTFAAVAISLRAPSTYRDRPSVGVSPLDIPPPTLSNNFETKDKLDIGL